MGWMGWLVGWLGGWVGWLVGWLVGGWVGWLVGGLVGWLGGGSVCLLVFELGRVGAGPVYNGDDKFFKELQLHWLASAG